MNLNFFKKNPFKKQDNPIPNINKDIEEPQGINGNRQHVTSYRTDRNKI